MSVLTGQSALSFRKWEALPHSTPAAIPVVVMMGPDQDEDAMVRAIRAAGLQGLVCALLPPRVIYSGRRFRRRAWYLEVAGRIEPSSFGDALWHLERFILDRLADGLPKPLLIMAGEAAATGMAVLHYAAHHVAGVLHIGGAIPEVAGWHPPPFSVGGLPVCVIREGGGKSDDVIAIFRECGAALAVMNGNGHCSETIAAGLRFLTGKLHQSSTR